jgi:glycosyltransferase involved in cell wall biosynthesis
MAKVSLLIPAFNEIRFIRRTLESVIGEADEIIISDNASTDGTSGVCAEYASKYPDLIKYSIDEGGNWPERFKSMLNRARGDYIRLIGAHDLISHGSTESMKKLLENNPDAVMAYSKWCIYLNQDYTFSEFHFMPEQSIQAFISASPFIRVKTTPSHFRLPSLYYGLYRKDTLVEGFNFLSSIFSNKVFTDTGLMAAMLKRGKLLCDDTSVFFWMKPRIVLDILSEYKRMAISASNGTCDSPLYWPFATICDCYAVSKDMQTMQNIPDNFDQECLDIFVKMYFPLFDALSKEENNKITLSDIPQVVPYHKFLHDEVSNAILKYQKEIQHVYFVSSKIDLSLLFRKLVKLIKYILPYSFVRIIQERKAHRTIRVCQ